MNSYKREEDKGNSNLRFGELISQLKRNYCEHGLKNEKTLTESFVIYFHYNYFKKKQTNITLESSFD